MEDVSEILVPQGLHVIMECVSVQPDMRYSRVGVLQSVLQDSIMLWDLVTVVYQYVLRVR